MEPSTEAEIDLVHKYPRTINCIYEQLDGLPNNLAHLVAKLLDNLQTPRNILNITFISHPANSDRQYKNTAEYPGDSGR